MAPVPINKEQLYFMYFVERWSRYRSRMVAGLHLILAASVFVLCACGSEGSGNLTTVSDQNQCILKHMLTYYTKSDDVTLSNMVKLFDAVTIGYHDTAPAHDEQRPSPVGSHALVVEEFLISILHCRQGNISRVFGEPKIHWFSDG